MKMKRWISGLLFSAGLMGQILIPFDWAGQNGMMVAGGQVLYNRDWFSGPLIFDGTFTSFPLKFGTKTYHLFSLSSSNQSMNRLLQADSAEVTSFFDYHRGDYLYDQLEIGAGFSSHHRRFDINGFKRSYSGNTFQYIHPGGGLAPIQQSYRIDYNSKSKSGVLNAGTGRFITRSGLPDSTSNGSRDDDILTSGFLAAREMGNWKFNMKGGQFLQQRKILHSARVDSTTTFLSRTHAAGNILWKNRVGMGLITDAQSLTSGSIFRELNWHTIYGMVMYEQVEFSGGLTALSSGNDAIRPFWKGRYHRPWGKGNLTLKFDHYSHPEHPIHFEIDEQDNIHFSEYSRFGAEFGRKSEKWVWKAGVYRGKESLGKGELNADYFSFNTEGEWWFADGWSIHGTVFTHREPSSFLPDIGTVTTVGLTGSAVLFKQNLKLNARLWGTGWFNRKSVYTFNILNELPSDSQGGISLPNQGFINFKAFATIGKVVITYRLMNLMNASSGIFPGLGDKYIWIQPNDTLPPLGRLMSFGVAWQFDN